MATAIASKDSFTWQQPLKVKIKDQELDLGRELHIQFEHARVTQSWATAEHTMIEVQTEDRQLRFHINGATTCQCTSWPEDDQA